jgi:hypothetical protein
VDGRRPGAQLHIEGEMRQSGERFIVALTDILL